MDLKEKLAKNFGIRATSDGKNGEYFRITSSALLVEPLLAGDAKPLNELFRRTGSAPKADPGDDDWLRVRQQLVHFAQNKRLYKPGRKSPVTEAELGR